MATTIFPDKAMFQSDVQVNGDILPRRTRAALISQQDMAVYPIPLTELRTWDALATNLPGAAAADDLGLVTGTLGTDSPTIQAGDLKAAGATTRYARCQVALPPEYVAGETVVIRAAAGMKTTVADGSCTIDFEARRIDRAAGVGADICATAATSINSLTAADKDFTITATTLGPGDLLDIRMAITCTDTATATAVIPIVDALELLCDIVL